MKAKTFEDGSGLPDRVYIICPGCLAAGWDDGIHVLNIKTTHKFNGDYEHPTFSPSLLKNWTPGRTCHSFVEHGMIRFLDDCNHPLRNQTVPLLDIEGFPHEEK